MVTRKIKTKILQKFCKHCSVLCEPVKVSAVAKDVLQLLQNFLDRTWLHVNKVSQELRNVDHF